MSSVEFALVTIVFFLFVFGIFDFGRAMWQWNAAAKAVHWGARFAIVNDPAAETREEVRRTYSREQVTRAWQGHGGTAYVLEVSPPAGGRRRQG